MKELILMVMLALPTPVNAQATTTVPLTIEQLIDNASKKYCVEKEIITKVIKCESDFNPSAVNWQDSHAKSKGSHGIAQFSRETIAYYSKKIGIENADPYNPQQAIETMVYMMSIGQGDHWTCYRNLKKL